MSKTEHLSLETGPHPDEWRDGATCDDCQIAHEMRVHELRNEGPLYNLEWLKKSNALGQSAYAFRDEIYEGARESGKDIRHVGESASARAERNEHHGTGGVSDE